MTGDLVDRYRGCLLGVAAGDALGMPVEGLTADHIRECVGEVREMIEPS
ncbi:MAG: ADP-ribosylglycohydrolase family protein, partial [Methanotrichaceae archaeon]